MFQICFTPLFAPKSIVHLSTIVAAAMQTTEMDLHAAASVVSVTVGPYRCCISDAKYRTVGCNAYDACNEGTQTDHAELDKSSEIRKGKLVCVGRLLSSAQLHPHTAPAHEVSVLHTRGMLSSLAVSALVLLTPGMSAEGPGGPSPPGMGRAGLELLRAFGAPAAGGCSWLSSPEVGIVESGSPPLNCKPGALWCPRICHTQPSHASFQQQPTTSLAHTSTCNCHVPSPAAYPAARGRRT